MYKYRSRLSKTEEKKNYRKAFYYIIATTSILLIFVIIGIPSVAKFAAFLTNIRQTSEPVNKNDTTAPIVPRIDPIAEFTNIDKVDIRGYTEPGATVNIFLNNKTDEVLADKSGEFIFSLNLNSGKNTITLSAKDLSGNESEKTDSIVVTLDREPPDLKINSPENGTEFYGTKQRQVIIEGTTEEESSVTINDRFVAVESNGSFTYLTTLNEGENIFTVKATDKAGNETSKELILSYIN